MSEEKNEEYNKVFKPVPMDLDSLRKEAKNWTSDQILETLYFNFLKKQEEILSRLDKIEEKLN